MARKNKRRLTEDQKRWLARLKEFVASPFFNWTGEKDYDFKECVEGKFAVFHADTSPLMEWDEKKKEYKSVGYRYQKDDWDAYDVVIGAEDYPTAEAIAKWNPSPRTLIIELESFEVLKDIKKGW